MKTCQFQVIPQNCLGSRSSLLEMIGTVLEIEELVCLPVDPGSSHETNEPLREPFGRVQNLDFSVKLERLRTSSSCRRVFEQCLGVIVENLSIL